MKVQDRALHIQNDSHMRTESPGPFIPQSQVYLLSLIQVYFRKYLGPTLSSLEAEDYNFC